MCNSTASFAPVLTRVGSMVQLGAMSFWWARPRLLSMQVWSPRHSRSVAIEDIIWEEAQLLYIHPVPRRELYIQPRASSPQLE